MHNKVAKKRLRLCYLFKNRPLKVQISPLLRFDMHDKHDKQVFQSAHFKGYGPTSMGMSSPRTLW